MEGSKFPEFHYNLWKDTYDTLHLYMQIIGKVKLTLCSFENQWWEVAFNITPYGITSGMIPFKYEVFSIDYNIHNNSIIIIKSDGKHRVFDLNDNLPVSKVYDLIMRNLSEIGIEVEINPLPAEIPNPIPLNEDTQHSTFNHEYVRQWWKIMMQMTSVFKEFRSRFRGKCSPVQFFWGTMDLNCTRFSGKKCTPPPNVDMVVREGDKEENFAYGFWAGDEKYPHPAVYAYMYPFPTGSPDDTYNSDIGCFLLPYKQISESEHPGQLILNFLEDKYQRTAKLSGWDTEDLKEDFHFKPHKNVTSHGKSEKRENVWSGSGNNTLQ